jgi:hypothetical protein
MKNQFQRFSKMKTIRDHYFRMILFKGYDDRLVIQQREYLFSIDNRPDLQEAQQYLVTSCNNYIIGGITQS